ncbi:septation protein SepH [Pseudarthrobacter sp. J1763]|uniref:septation protein SepH n=1 Tax=Pseudarthrobacter sp. J1763 TaxID=3420445 RepID=UPI003D26DA0C
MQDLRLVGVHEDGEHLLLSGNGGEVFLLPINEALRVAASRTPSRIAAEAAAGDPAKKSLTPRDIQARIRAGATAAEVAEESGLDLAHVQRYEGPVLAEREYITQLARKVEVATPSPGHDVYRSAFGDEPASLGEMVSHRLTAHGIKPNTVEWDSWRREDGIWTVVAQFTVPDAARSGVGEEPPAQWSYNPAHKSIQNNNRWAQQLSELEPLDGPLPARRLSAVSDRPFDFETDADDVPAGVSDSDSLLDMLRSRRGQRLGVDEESDDALALILTNGIPAAHPRPAEYEDDAESDDSVDWNAAEHDDYEPAAEESQPVSPAASRFGKLSLAPRMNDDESLRLHDGVSTDTREIRVVASPARTTPTLADELLGGARNGSGQSADQDSSATAEDQDFSEEVPSEDSALSHAKSPKDSTQESKPTRKDQQPERRPAKQRRSSVPSWDEIVFGTKGD